MGKKNKEGIQTLSSEFKICQKCGKKFTKEEIHQYVKLEHSLINSLWHSIKVCGECKVSILLSEHNSNRQKFRHYTDKDGRIYKICKCCVKILYRDKLDISEKDWILLRYCSSCENLSYKKKVELITENRTEHKIKSRIKQISKKCYGCNNLIFREDVSKLTWKNVKFCGKCSQLSESQLRKQVEKREKERAYIGKYYKFCRGCGDKFYKKDAMKKYGDISTAEGSWTLTYYCDSCRKLNGYERKLLRINNNKFMEEEIDESGSYKICLYCNKKIYKEDFILSLTGIRRNVRLGVWYNLKYCQKHRKQKYRVDLTKSKKCELCENVFYKKKSETDNYFQKKKYCGMECYQEHRNIIKISNMFKLPYDFTKKKLLGAAREYHRYG